MLLARRGLPNDVKMPAQLAVLVLVGWLVISTAWSSVRVVSVTGAVALAVTTGVGLYLARTFSATQLLALLAIGMQPGLLASAWAIRREWPGAIDPYSSWVGVYFNRNSLGPPAVIATGAAVVLVCVLWWKRPPYWVAMTILLAALVVLDTWLQRGGGSATSWVMLVAFMVTFGVWSVAARGAELRAREEAAGLRFVARGGSARGHGDRCSACGARARPGHGLVRTTSRLRQPRPVLERGLVGGARPPASRVGLARGLVRVGLPSPATTRDRDRRGVPQRVLRRAARRWHRRRPPPRRRTRVRLRQRRISSNRRSAPNVSTDRPGHHGRPGGDTGVVPGREPLLVRPVRRRGLLAGHSPPEPRR